MPPQPEPTRERRSLRPRLTRGKATPGTTAPQEPAHAPLAPVRAGGLRGEPQRASSRDFSPTAHPAPPYDLRLTTYDSTSPRPHAPTSLTALLPLILLIPALYALARHFDGLYGQDPFAYYDYAVGPLRAALAQPALPPPYYYPPGYPLLVTLATYIVGQRPLAGQLTSLLAGALVPLLTALLAHEALHWGTSVDRPRREAIASSNATRALRTPSPSPFRGRVAAAAAGRGPSHPHGPPFATTSLYVIPPIAGLVIACTGQLWQSAIVIMSDTAAIALATAGVWALLRYNRLRHGGWLSLAAGCLAWAILTRWAYALVALPCAIYALSLLIRSTPAERRRFLLHTLGAAAVTITILSPVLLPALETLRQPNPQFSELSRWNPLYAFRREFTNADGRLTYELPNGLYYATLLARPLYFTPLLAFAALPGLWRIARRPSAPLLLLLGWLAAIIGFHAGSTWQNVRYILACAPPGAILVALGFATLWERRDRRLTVATSALLTLGLAWMLASNFPLLGNFIDRKEADLAIARSITLPADAHLLSFGLTLTLSHYTPYPTHELSELTPDTLATLLAENHPTYLVLDVPNIETQWHNRAPETNYHWLRDNPGLTPLSQHGPYTLFQIGPSASPPLPSLLVTRYSLTTQHSALSTQHSAVLP